MNRALRFALLLAICFSGNWSADRDAHDDDRAGAVLLSPFLQLRAVSNISFNHYPLLNSLEDNS